MLRNPLSYRQTGCLIAACGLLAAPSSATYAGDLSADADVNVSYLYNDNPTQRAQNNTETSLFRFGARATIDYITPMSSWQISPRVSRNYYTDRGLSNLENTNWYLDGKGKWNPTERQSAGITMVYSNLGILTDVLGDQDTDPGEGGNTSRLRLDDTVQRLTVTPSWNYQLTLKDSIGIRATAAGTDYALDNTNRADNRSVGGGIDWFRAWTTRMGAGVGISVNKFESEKFLPEPLESVGVKQRNNSVGLNVSFNYRLTDRSAITGNYGLTKTDSENDVALFDPDTGDFIGLVTNEFTTDNNVYALNYNRQGFRHNFKAGVTRFFVPASDGSESIRDTLRFGWSSRWTEKMSSNLNFTVFQQQAIFDENACSDGDPTCEDIQSIVKRKNYLGAINASTTWRVARPWYVSLVYSFRLTRREPLNSNGNDTLRAKSNQIGVSFNYKWENIY